MGLNRGLEKIEFHVIIDDRRKKGNVRINLCERESNCGKETMRTEAVRKYGTTGPAIVKIVISR